MKIIKKSKRKSCLPASLNFQRTEASKQGFTLIEIMLYVGIVSVIIPIFSVAMITFLESKVKNQTIAEVEQNGAQVMSEITQAIRSADAINSPVPGDSAVSLSLVMADSGKNPTLFDLSGSDIQIKEGADSPINLSSSRVVLSGLNFSNLSRAETVGTVRVQFTLSHINPGGRNEWDYSRTFYGSASARR